jgi:hypothetical protein
MTGDVLNGRNSSVILPDRYGQLRLDDKRQIEFDTPSRLMWLEVAGPGIRCVAPWLLKHGPRTSGRPT